MEVKLRSRTAAARYFSVDSVRFPNGTAGARQFGGPHCASRPLTLQGNVGRAQNRRSTYCGANLARVRMHALTRPLRCIIAGGILVCLTLLPRAIAQSENSAHACVPKLLFRNPVRDGAADPSLVWDRAKGRWLMFYTNRRADLSSNDSNGVGPRHQNRHRGIEETRYHMALRRHG